MSGKEPLLTPLESRKRMLIAESELNRAQLFQEWESMTAPVRRFAERAKSFSAMAAAAAALATGLFTFRHGQSLPAAEKPSWIDTILKAVRLASSIGLAFRARGDKEENQ